MFGGSPHSSFRRYCARAEGEKGCCKEGRILTPGGSHIKCPHEGFRFSLATAVKISAVARAPFLPPGIRRILPSSQQSATTRTRRRRPADLNATCTLQTQTTSAQLCKTRSVPLFRVLDVGPPNTSEPGSSEAKLSRRDHRVTSAHIEFKNPTRLPARFPVPLPMPVSQVKTTLRAPIRIPRSP